MNIVVAANSKYMRYLYIMLSSLIENNRDEEINIFKEEQHTKIKHQCSDKKGSLKCNAALIFLHKSARKIIYRNGNKNEYKKLRLSPAIKNNTAKKKHNIPCFFRADIINNKEYRYKPK